MRNLKRALALALSSVMLMGMMVVGTSAASYPDVDASNDSEAIEVMQAIEVMVGDDAGNFNPDQKVTRAEAAVVIAKLMDLDLGDFKGADLSFTDVPDWAASFVAACQADGIVAGYSATQFGSNDSVTAVQYALMVMKTLGYFQNQADYGEDWVLATAKQAGKIDLFDGLDVSVNAPLTREQVARVTLNALESAMVEAEEKGTTITTGDITIVTGASKYEKVESTATKANKFYDGEANVLQLGEDLFSGKLIKTFETDDLGRPGAKWEYKGEEIGVYADAADKIVVVDDEDYTTVEEVYNEMIDEDYDFTRKGDIANDEYNGTAVEDALVVGDKVEFYINADGVVNYAIVTGYAIAEITEIDAESVVKADKEDGATCWVTLGDNDFIDLDKDIVGFDAETYVEGAYILYAMNGGEIVASQIAESFTGEVDALKGDKARIGGEYYVDVYDLLAIGDEGTFYMDLAGQIVAADVNTEKSDNYAYIYNATYKTSNDKYGNEVYAFTAYLVLADGTLASYVVDADEIEKIDAAITSDSDADAVVTALENKDLFAYAINKDGELTFKTEADKIGAADSTLIDDEHAVITVAPNTYKTTADTEFVFFWNEGSKVKTSTATGYKNVEFTNVIDFVYDKDDNSVLYAFVSTENTMNTTAQIAVVCDTAYVVTEDADGNEYYTYTFVVDGEETELVTEAVKLQTLMVDGTLFAKGIVCEYELDADGYVSAFDLAANGEITAVTDNYVVVTGAHAGQYDLDGVEKYTITKEYDDVLTVSVKSGAKLSASDDGSVDGIGDKNDIFYVVDGDDLVEIYVIKYVR